MGQTKLSGKAIGFAVCIAFVAALICVVLAFMASGKDGLAVLAMVPAAALISGVVGALVGSVLFPAKE